MLNKCLIFKAKIYLKHVWNKEKFFQEGENYISYFADRFWETIFLFTIIGRVLACSLVKS